VFALTTLVEPRVARAESAESAEATAERTNEARQLFQTGVEQVQRAQWGEALAAFERSAALVEHPLTTFNIGACQRALGRYTLARRTLAKALAAGKETQTLPPSYASDAEAFLGEINGLLARVAITVQPAGATLTVDGRPLLAEAGGFVAGVAPPGRGAPASGGFEVLLDPGAHVLSLALKGYTDLVVNRTFAPGSRSELPLLLERLPATLKVASDVPGASVRLGLEQLGLAPINVQKPPGAYRVLVEKRGFERYTSEVRLNAGETTSLRAKLVEERIPVTKRWWFWTAAVGVVAGAAIATFAVTRPEPSPPPYDGGSTGWVVMP
jgi:PEGA domain